MSRKRAASDPNQAAGVLAGIVRHARLTWRLLRDGQVSPWLKMLPLGWLLYLLFPIDAAPDLFLGLGQLDDLALLLLGIKLFVHLCPTEIVEQHLREMESVPASYRVVEEEEMPASCLEVPYRLIDEEK